MGASDGSWSFDTTSAYVPSTARTPSRTSVSRVLFANTCASGTHAFALDGRANVLNRGVRDTVRGWSAPTPTALDARTARRTAAAASDARISRARSTDASAWKPSRHGRVGK
eukprot:31311-Pelagococcus_subviridis.AAC.11